MNGNEPATKADLQNAVDQLRSEMGHQIHDEVDQLRSEIGLQFHNEMDQLRSEMNHQYRDVVERISDSETRVLSAIYDLADSGNKRMTHIEGDNAAMNNRLAKIEDRLLKIEKRVNLPPGE